MQYYKNEAVTSRLHSSFLRLEFSSSKKKFLTSNTGRSVSTIRSYNSDEPNNIRFFRLIIHSGQNYWIKYLNQVE